MKGASDFFQHKRSAAYSQQGQNLGFYYIFSINFLKEGTKEAHQNKILQWPLNLGWIPTSALYCGCHIGQLDEMSLPTFHLTRNDCSILTNPWSRKSPFVPVNNHQWWSMDKKIKKIGTDMMVEVSLLRG